MSMEPYLSKSSHLRSGFSHSRSASPMTPLWGKHYSCHKYFVLFWIWPSIWTSRQSFYLAPLQEHTKEELDSWNIVRVSEDFRVIALGLPVPKYKGNPLDPPLRSRFQARDIYYLPFKVSPGMNSQSAPQSFSSAACLYKERRNLGKKEHRQICSPHWSYFYYTETSKIHAVNKLYWHCCQKTGLLNVCRRSLDHLEK